MRRPPLSLSVTQRWRPPLPASLLRTERTLPGLSVAESPGERTENRSLCPASGRNVVTLRGVTVESLVPHQQQSGGSQQDLYQVLSDELKRKQYDTYGVAGFKPEWRRGGRVSSSTTKRGVQHRPGRAVPEDLRRVQRGEGLRRLQQHFVMELTFSEAAKGAQKPLTVNLDDACPRCDGKGSEPGTKEEAPSSSPSASCAEAPDRPRRGRPSPCPSPQVPASCQADQVIRLQGKGIRRMNSYSYGDHYVHIKIRVEKQADEESTERPGRGRRVLCRLFHTGMNLRGQTGLSEPPVSSPSPLNATQTVRVAFTTQP
ncbi:hypothetical protein F7725_006276, partial [Dissostichus mawsoni]